jgi:iron-sulfur cluster assembly protein
MHEELASVAAAGSSGASVAPGGAPAVLSLTPRAAQAALVRAREAGVEGFFLRVAVVAGGCNGLSWDLYFVEAPGAEDTVLECGPLRALVDRASLPLLSGTVVDLSSGRQPTFVFHNPRAKKACSCGASFEI